LNQVVADFTPKIQSAADATFLRGLEENVLRIASDFYWAYKLPTYLSSNGLLTIAKEDELRKDINKVLLDKSVVIPEELVPNLLQFVTYVLKGIFHLNKFASGDSLVLPQPSPENRLSGKRHRIVERLGQGFGRAKRRRFFLSKLDKALGGIPRQILEQQIRILISHGVLTAPTHRSVCLHRSISHGALLYLKDNCDYNDQQLAALLQANEGLQD